jgi:hypothetical protein
MHGEIFNLAQPAFEDRGRALDKASAAFQVSASKSACDQSTDSLNKIHRNMQGRDRSQSLMIYFDFSSSNYVPIGNKQFVWVPPKSMNIVIGINPDSAGNILSKTPW